jgi:shikimate dehydrogenase
MRLFGLIGKSLTHSFSKEYFTKKFSEQDIKDCIYENFELASIADLPELLKNNPGLCGLNITIPYKEDVLALLSFKNSVVEETGACNCIKIKNRKLLGFNTDVTGFQTSLIPFLQQHHKKAIVLGTGGASRAVQYTLKNLNIDFTLISHSRKTSLSYEDLNKEIMMQHQIIINTTPLGTYPNVNVYPAIPYQFITGQHLLFDLIYNPAATQFLLKGKEQGATISNGYNMLQIQAEESWKIWND